MGQDSQKTALGFAVSRDGRQWTKSPHNPVLQPDENRPWESHYVTSQSLIRMADGSWRIWYASRTKPPFVHKYFAIGTAKWKGPSGTSEPGSPVAAALHAALAKNIAHARDWLDQADYKSLVQSAGSLQLLAELIKARSDDETWQTAVGKVVSAAGEVQSAARDAESTKCKAALEALEKSSAAAAGLQPTGRPQALPRPPALRPLMLTMDAIQADAKIALLTGNVEAAKKQAHVLAELSRLVSNSRTTEQWSSLAGDFASAATAAATSTESDPKTVRQLMRTVSQRCEACHENSRTR
jgi:hypothetical protein